VVSDKLFSHQKIGADHLDIITFYNEVFIPTVKPLLVDLGPCASPNKNSEEKSAADGMYWFTEIKEHC
jgi:retinoblastoma-like protein 1